ncbi:putative rhamnogalacturonate lyase C [Fusarium austroafricanum]|uniref:Putative rhamnogalacturonate lyase C n=1 Tax=Fusarium austroafricanum TaxID=2364996 RepID=A0A8H4NXH0_9HYPO|nr:putative rhamnogalacturonate lyase C [Fusarium austroafricanum]
MSAPSPATSIKTRLLIISDTHGSKPKSKNKGGPSTEDELRQKDVMRVTTGWREPLPEADVVLHCGDLTKRTTIPEFENTFSVLRSIRAPLKLAIAGNHDIALHDDYWINEFGGPQDTLDKVKKIVRKAERDGVRYLTEGVHEFTLQTGAFLRVYASPWTPAYGGWAFQYKDGHDFNIPTGIDVAMTHGPLRGICDFAGMTGTPAGCPDLLAAVACAKPKIHCFGHIHEAWGMYHVAWDGDGIDEDRSRKVGLKGLRPNRVTQNEKETEMTRIKLIEMSKQRAARLDLTQGDSRLVEREQTLFVNAAIMDIRYRPIQLPWLIDVDLARAVEPDQA